MSETEEEKKARRKKYNAAYYAANRESEKARATTYRAANRKSTKAYNAAYYAANRESEKARTMAYRTANSDAWTAYSASYVAANRENRATKRKIYNAANRELINAYWKNRYDTDESFVVANRLRARLHHALKAKSGAKKAASTFDLVGCPPADLVSYLESLFLPNMSWENRSEWEIDHIRPCVSFDLTDPEQQKACFHFSNLQPLWKSDNRSKSDKEYETWLAEKEQRLDNPESTTAGRD